MTADSPSPDRPSPMADALAHASLALVVLDAEGRVQTAEGLALRDLFGAGGPVVGRTLVEHARVSPTLRELAERARGGARAMAALEVAGGILRLQAEPSRDGAVVIVGLHAAAAVAGDAEPSSDEAFLRLFQASPVPISISTLEGGVFSHCNDAFVRIFGYPREEVVGGGSVELGMWSAEQRAAAIGELREKGVLVGHESTVTTKSGDVLDIIFNMERIWFAGRPHLVGFFYDITARKRAERELRDLYLRLKEVDDLKGQLIANVSHELRTPLTLILGLTERLLERAPGGDERRDLEAIERSGLALLRQVNDLLELARLDAGGLVVRRVPTDVAALSRLVAAPFEVLAAQRGQALTVDAPSALEVAIDADKVERILVNLLSNALKYSPDGGRVRVALRSDGDRLTIEVADSGPGIPIEHRARVFERFFQVDGAATRKVGGTGLGLAIVRELAEAHGGEVHAGEAPEGGALMTVALAAPPAAVTASGEAAGVMAARSELARAAVAELRGGGREVGGGDEGRPLVLVVEDHDEMRAFIAELLAGDYRVATAADGLAGLDAAARLRPAVIVTDVMMPGLTGDELVRRVRADATLADVRIVLVSAKADDGLRVRALREGADDYLVKPFGAAELRARVGNQAAVHAERVRLQAEVAQKGEGVERLEGMLRQAQKMEAIGRLAGGVAHDFNNLLTVIGGYAAVLLEVFEPGDPNIELASEIKRAAERAADLTRQLLAFSRRQILELRLVDVNDVVGRLDRMLGRLIGEDVAVATRLTPDLGLVRADAGQLEQVVVNLVVNARDAMPSGGRLTVETDEVVLGEAYARMHADVAPGHYVVLSVSDSGHGMSPEVQQRIFEPFFTTKPVGKGTGLGLATVYGIVRQSGGHIAFDSVEGQGTTFRVYLPRVAAAAARAVPVPEPPPPPGSEVVLLVEDDAMVRAFTSRALARLGYEVLEAVDGQQALELWQGRAGGIDVVVTDVVMPRVGGRDMVQRMRVDKPDQRVLYMSGYTDDAALRLGVLDQGAAFVQKPFTATALARAMRRVLTAP